MGRGWLGTWEESGGDVRVPLERLLKAQGMRDAGPVLALHHQLDRAHGGEMYIVECGISMRLKDKRGTQ